MPRSGGGVYSVPAGTTATPNTSIESAKYNTFLADLTNDLNAARPIVAGGTGATTKTGAQQALDLEPGVDIQAYNATLAALAALTLAADKLIYATGANTLAAADLTAFARTLLAGVDAAAMRTLLALGDMATKDDVAIADITATGTASAATYLAGDGSWKTVPDQNFIWHDVSGSRATGVAYQNTTGNPMDVAITFTQASGSRSIEISADNSTWIVYSTSQTTVQVQRGFVTLPPGWYIQITGGAITSLQWLERRAP